MVYFWQIDDIPLQLFTLPSFCVALEENLSFLSDILKSYY